MAKPDQSYLTVGIGASAGGLAVLKTFVGSLAVTDHMAFLIVQHLAPDHESILAELLARESKLPVKDAEHNEEIIPGHIYVIPPDAYLELQGSRIQISTPKESRGARQAVNYLFKSLAQECGENCAGIILSGAGRDGTEGLQAIKAAGGLTLAQDPDTAEHTSMPLTAIDAEAVDVVLHAEQMVEILRTFIQHPLQVKDGADTLMLDNDINLDAISTLLKSTENFNLHQYKTATVKRRIIRRMGLTDTPSWNEYLHKLRTDASERKQLTEDLLINVTEFFRDPEAFQFLQQKVIGDVLEHIGKDEEIRVWVAGCASGEEAYSLAILLLAALERSSKKNAIKIFATDIDEHAISIARKGTYPGSALKELPQHYVDTYFVKTHNEDCYRVTSQVRDLISFAVQDVVNDPPFGHMHLICCRNLLIYLTRTIQERVINSFYFALKNNGYLFLGSSETLGIKSEIFSTESKKWRIYRKIPGYQEKRFLLDNLNSGALSESNRKQLNTRVERKFRDVSVRADQMRQSILDTFLPPSVIVDQDGTILYNHGNWAPYISFRSGEPRNNIIHLVIPSLKSRMRSALFKVLKTNAPVTFVCTLPNEIVNTQARSIRVVMAPITEQEFSDQRVIGVVFYEEAIESEQHKPLTQDDENNARQNMEQELAEMREELQNTIEELETSGEELKASHEEALSTNEELQSANEELEANSEELRSLNEELSTVNAQLKEKIEQLQKANDDVENFFASTDLPTIFLNPELEVQRYTPAAEQLLKMGPKDIGRPIASLGRDLVDNVLQEECRQVLQNFQPIRVEKQTYEGNWYIRQITPYRTEERRIDGVVIVFQDVTEIKKLSRRAQNREQQQAAVAKLGMLALSGAEPEIIMQQAVRQVANTLNAEYCKILQYRPDTHDFLMVAGVGWQEGLVGNASVGAGQDSQAGYTLLSQEPVVVTDLRTEKRFNGPELLFDHRIISGISCVINHSSFPYGVLGVHSREYEHFSEDDANFLLSVANMLSTALRMQTQTRTLHEREEEFRTLANSIPQLAWMADGNGDLYWYNQRWYDFTGTTLSDVEGWSWQKVHHPDHVQRVTEQFQANLISGEEWEDTFPLRGKDGQYRWFLSRAKPIVNQHGTVVRWFGTNTDITEQRDQANALRDSENKLRLAMATNKIGSFEYSLYEEAKQWDPLIRDLWGVDASEQPTQDIFWEGVHPDDADAVAVTINRAMEPASNGHYHSIYRVINRKTKHIVWVEASGKVIFEDGKPLKVVGMIMDISERKTLEESLKNAIKELQIADQSKNDFLSILGHELRNPLAALSGSVDILQNELPEKQKLFGVMKHSVDTMARLLDDLLDLNRVSQNKIQLSKQWLDLADIIDNVIALTASACEAKQQQVSVNITRPMYLEGDAARLEQILSNLVLNACRYTPDGGKISITTSKRDYAIEVYIQDNGVGISEEHHEKIFNPFFQIKQDQQAASGLGIGLALSKNLANLHGGEIEVSSAGLGKGSCFTVHLPCRPAAENQMNQKPVYEAPAIRAGLKIIVVEDNPNILAIMPILLENLGCVVETAASGEEGIAKVEWFAPDVLLVDIGLPDVSGHVVAERLRAAGYKGMLVALSGYSHKEVQEKSRAVGFDYHLAKPANLADISAILALV